jgi:hypothetical protein
MIEDSAQRIKLFWQGHYRNRGYKQKTVLGLIPGKDGGFRDNFVL